MDLEDNFGSESQKAMIKASALYRVRLNLFQFAKSLRGKSSRWEMNMRD